MRCVNETLPPRDRARWLLITMRLSASNLAGTARTLVAVGTVSDTFMFLTTLAAAPRSGTCGGPSAVRSGVLRRGSGRRRALLGGAVARRRRVPAVRTGRDRAARAVVGE